MVTNCFNCKQKYSEQAQGLDDGIFWKHETLSTIIDYEMLLV